MKTKPILRRLNNGWIWLAVLIVTYATLFLIGKNTTSSAQNPLIEGRSLSELTDDLDDVDPIPWGDHDEAAEVLRRHTAQISPVLIEWLDSRDSVPEVVYFSTMRFLERFGRSPLENRGVYSNQHRAAKAFRVLGGRDPEAIKALERNLEYYKAHEPNTKGRDPLVFAAENALKRIKETNKAQMATPRKPSD